MATDRRGIIVPLILLAFIFLSPDPVRPPRHLDNWPTLHDVIAEEQHSREVLQNSTYNAERFASPDAIALNITGLEADRGYSWDALPAVRSKARRWLGDAYGLEIEDAESVHRALEFEAEDVGLYKNVSGFVHGKWVRSKLETAIRSPVLNLSDYAPMNPFGGPRHVRPFGRNITGEGGDVRLRFHEKQATGDPTFGVETTKSILMSVDLTITEPTSLDEHELRVFGVFFPTLGQALMTTTSEKFAGIYALPHFALSNQTFHESRELLDEALRRSIQRQINGETDRHNLWTSKAEGLPENPFATPLCELVVYLQQLSTPGMPAASAMRSFLERELRFPTGAFLPASPPVRFAMTAFSPDCGFVIESHGPPDYVPQEGDHLEGIKLEVLYQNSRHHILGFTVVLALQLALLMRQMREASTPSTRSRLSFYTIAMLSLGDGFTTMSFMLISLFIGGLWVNLVATAFLAFISVSFFGMRFLMDVWSVQAPERERRWREEYEQERQREERFRQVLEEMRERRAESLRVAAGGENIPSTGGDPENPPASIDTSPPANQQDPPAATLPLPVTASRPTDTGATPVFMPSDQEGLTATTPPTETPGTTAQPVPQFRESFGALYTRFYLLLLFTLFLSLNAASWPSGPRRIYFTTIALAYLSFWLPQIKRNVHRNCRRALDWEFVLGQSLLRLSPFAYFYAYSNNVLFAERDLPGLAIMALWVWLQVVFLASQELFGPRWFVRKDWAPPAYDYHPLLREDEEGGTMPIGSSQPVIEDSTSTPSSPTLRRASTNDPSLPRTDSKRRDSLSQHPSPRQKGTGTRTFDCAICMQTLDVPVIEAGASANETSSSAAGGFTGQLARRMYMVTPCRHIFHSACLEGWMKYRLQCPVCREGLPPI